MAKKSSDDERFEALLREATKDSVGLMPKAGLMEGRFVIKRLLGSGGMGVVYEAMDVKKGVRVALKMLSEVNASGVYYLKQEFRALADLVHPNLIVLHELFFDSGSWFFTMDLVVGKTLLDHLAVDSDPVRLRRVFLQLAAGIHAIHQAGKLHRDLKPNNVLVTPKGEVTILDFGLVADQKAGGVGQTIADQGISGTPTYMAPEQAAAGPALPASDWYAFGAMLFEALAGHPPFVGTVRDVIAGKQLKEAPRLESICPDIPKPLSQLCADLLQRDMSKRPEYEEIARTFGGTAHTASAPAHGEALTFVGRHAELGMLEDALQSTENGEPVVVFVSGPSGIGKSTLIEHFLSRVAERHHAVILKGRCYEQESVPFKACDSLMDELTRYLRRLPERHAARLMPRHVLALAKIFPVLHRLEIVKQTKDRHPLPPDPSELRRVAFLAAKELLAHITAQDPLILFVDDLQWSDEDGMKLLTSLVLPPDPPPLMIIGAFRSEDTDASPGLAMLHERIRDWDGRNMRKVVMEKLGAEESLTLARSLLDMATAQAAAEIVAEGEGSPFLITELARFSGVEREAGKRLGLDRTMACHVAGLSELERTLVSLISISARPMDEGLLQAAVGAGQIAGALRSLETMRLVRKTGSGSRLVVSYHDRMREAVVSVLSAERIRSCHHILASAFEKAEAPDPVAMTTHLIGAGELAGAGTYAAQAAHLAREALAFENAARFYRIALDLNPGDGAEKRKLELALGEALAHAGHGSDAARAFMRAADGAPIEEQLELCRMAAEQWINTGHMQEGLRELDNVLGAVGLTRRSRASESRRDLKLNRARLKLMAQNGKKHMPSEMPRDIWLKMRACEVAALGLWATDTIQSAAFCARYLRLALKAGIELDIIRGLALEAAHRAVEGVKNRTVTERYMSHAETLGQSVDDPEIRAFLALSRGMISFSEGRLMEAMPFLEHAERICTEECTRKRPTLEITETFLGSIYTRLGSWKKLQRGWDKWMATALERGNLFHLTVCRTWNMGCLRWLAVDQVDEARRHLSAAIREWPRQRHDMQLSQAGLSEAYIHLYVGDADKAFELCRALVDRLSHGALRRVQMQRVHYAVVYANCALALAAVTPDNAPLLQIAKQQAMMLKKENSPFGIPSIPYIMGTVAYLRGDEEKAVGILRTAVVTFDEAHYKLFAAATRRRLGKLVGGDEGRELMDEADRAMREETIVNQERVTGLLAPGFRQ